MLTLRKRKNSKVWYVRGTVRVGDRIEHVPERSTGLSEKAAAEVYRVRLESDIQQALLFGRSWVEKKLTFAQVGAEYIKRPGGIGPVEVWRIGQLNEHMGELPLSDLLEGWRTFQLERCANLKPATVERFRSTLQAALNHAGRLHGITVPRIPKIAFRNGILRYLTAEQRDRLLSAYPAHVQPIMLTLCFQGCRTQEALQLQWEHVNLERRTMFFPRTKSGHPRTIKMHARVFEAIEKLFQTRSKPTSGHVFLNRMGEPYSDTRDYKLPGGNPLRSAHGTACKKAGIENFRVHDWRHHFACWCVMSGVDLETLKRLGGWRTLRMLERYMAVSTEHMDRAIELVA